MLTQEFPYFFTAAHAEWEQRARAFAGQGAIPARVAALGDAGLLAPIVPQVGAVPDLRAVAVLRYCLAGRDPLDDLALIIQGLGSFPLSRQPGFEAELGAARAGRLVLVFGLTEPEAGSDVKALRTLARPDGDGYRLTGRKHLISNAPDCDAAVVFAQLDGRPACFYVANPPTAAQRVAGHSIGELRLNDTPARLVSTRGMALALGTLDRFRPSVGAAAAGIARAALEQTVTHVKARIQFGAPLANQPVVRARLAEMAMGVQTATLAALHACHFRDTAPPDARTGVTSAMGKVTATEMAWQVLDQAVQLHGGLGVIEGHPIEELFRALRPLRIYEGATDVLKEVIGGGVLEG